ncbi:MAG: hypothetical protein LH618_13275, partial [Saprospiraceae bacterium]|nr:hypothetical protein [Saprospiraceae bacterium]
MLSFYRLAGASGLIWKIRDDHSKLVPVAYSKYWRFQAFTYSNARAQQRFVPRKLSDKQIFK